MTQGSRFQHSPLAIAVASLLFTPAAFSQTETVVVTGNQLNTIEAVVPAEELEKRQAIDLSDVFREQTEVTVGGASGYAQKIYVRGLEDTMLNVSIDGAVQSGSLFHHQGRVSIEPELLKQVEVSAGAGRATDGAGALGGAIRFETKDPTDLLQGSERFGGFAKTTYYSNTNGYKSTLSGYGRLTDSVSALITANYSDQNDYVDGEGEQATHTAYETEVGLAKVVAQLSDNHKLTLSFDRRYDDAYRLARPHMAVFSRNYPLQQNTTRETATIKHVLSSDNALLHLESTLYHTDLTLERLNDPRFGTYEGNIKTIGGDIRNTSRFGNHSVTYGVDFRRDEAAFTGSGYTSNDEGKIWGGYVQGDFQLTDPLLVSLGARYDRYDYDEGARNPAWVAGSKDLSFSDSGFSPNVSASYQLTPAFSIFAGYAEAIRGAQLGELWISDYVYSSANRQKEEAQNIETGVKWSQGSWSAVAQVFDSEIENAVDVKDDTYQNVGTLESKGVSLQVAYQGAQWQSVFGYSHIDSELDGKPLHDGDMNLGTSSGDIFTTNVQFLPAEDVTLGWSAKYALRLTDVPEGTQEKPGFGVHDIYAQWTPGTQEAVQLTLSVKNLFDHAYRDHASLGQDYTGPLETGRDIRFGINYRF